MTTFPELLVSGVVAYVLYQCISFYRTRSKIASIPTLGSDHFILAYFHAWKFMLKGQSILREGYKKYNGTAFKIPTLSSINGWLIVVSGEDMVEDMRKAPSSVLSFREASLELFQSQHQWASHVNDDPFHISVVRMPLTRTFPSEFGNVSDEIRASCATFLNAGSDWESLSIYGAMVHVVCRTSNRLFVGLPLCRDPEYCKIQEDWTLQISKGAYLLSVIPAFLRPIVSYALYPVRSGRKNAERLLRPILTERLEKRAQSGPDWEGKPNDVISWIIDMAPARHLNVEDVTMKIMLLNFAAIHTTSLTSTFTLLDLAARQEYIVPIRAEIEEAIREHGWTKDAMAVMRKLDSFIKESTRLGGISAVSMRRKAVTGFTFSNGVVVPAGYNVAVASAGIQTDPGFYEDPNTFKGFRFLETQEDGKDEYDSLRHQMVTLDPTYLFFGYGRQACPGRFFAVNEVKAILAHIIINYDIKLPGDSTVVPEELRFAGNRVPKSSTQLLFRKRKVD